LNAKDVTTGDVGVALGGTESGVTEEGLNVADVSAAFKFFLLFSNISLIKLST